ncbi:hypothetical protein EJ465_08875, partial [Campylobacter coli]|nr:hypothetical protein [Campylobacter coli]EAH5380446.1 hypothetical protein [Campylobacter jejuni]EAH7020698.1 hypothetical protein [Campylobacter coli]EAI0397408.1 hypothetical protein [Campylobacter jejuni]EAI7749673.1 hypothetical protein [Campylobacter jejuni]
YKIYFFILYHPIKAFFILVLIVSSFSFVDKFILPKKERELSPIIQIVIKDSESIPDYISNTKSKEVFLSQNPSLKDLFEKMATEYPLKSGLNFGKPEYIAGVATVEKDWGEYMEKILKEDSEELLKKANSCKIIDVKSKMQCFIEKINYVFKIIDSQSENCTLNLINNKDFYNNLYEVIYFAFYDDEYDKNLKKEEYFFSKAYYAARVYFLANKQCFIME